MAEAPSNKILKKDLSIDDCQKIWHLAQFWQRF